MTLRKQIAAFMSLVFAAGTAGAQDLKSGPYKLPYKNTYVKEVFVAENEFRTAKPEHIKPRTFAEARKILPSPVWEGHEKEVEMYWHAWQIAVGNIRQPQEDSGFVSPYLDIAYNGNIFMWDASFMMMFARYGYRFFPFQRTLEQLLRQAASRRVHLPRDPCRRLRLLRALRSHLDGAQPAAVGRTDVLPPVRRHRPPAQGFPRPVRLCQVVAAQPHVARRHLLVERMGDGHGQHAPREARIQPDLLARRRSGRRGNPSRRPTGVR